MALSFVATEIVLSATLEPLWGGDEPLRAFQKQFKILELRECLLRLECHSRSKHNDTGWAKMQAARKENQFIMGKAWMRCAGNEIIRDDATFRQCHLPKVSVLKSPSLQNRAEVK